MAENNQVQDSFNRLVADFLRELERDEQRREAHALQFGRQALVNLGPSLLDQMVQDQNDPGFKQIFDRLLEIHPGQAEDSIFIVAWTRFDRLRHEGGV